MQNPTLLKIPKELFRGQSDLAYCFEVGTGKIWLPKSQLRDFELIGEVFEMWAPEWLIGKNNLELFIDTSYMPSLF